MGQKSNPNSFQLSLKKNNNAGSFQNKIEYASLIKDKIFVSSNLIFFFEKRNCLVKDCTFLINNQKSLVTIFISFLIVKRLKKSRKTLKILKPNLSVSLLVKKIFKVLSFFGYFSSKRLVLQNLNKLAKNYQKSFFKKEHVKIEKSLALFKKEIFFQTGIFLFCLLKNTNNNAFLFSKYIGYFFRILHRTKKIDKFLLFLAKFVQNIDTENLSFRKITGFKIQIKGRLIKRQSRSQVRVYEKGTIPLQSVSAKINYSLTHVNTTYGIFGIKVWIFE